MWCMDCWEWWPYVNFSGYCYFYWGPIEIVYG